MNVESKQLSQEQEEKKEVITEEKATAFKEESINKDFIDQFEKIKEKEKRLSFGIESMKETLAQQKDPDFKAFWEIRKLCLPIFKENINPIARTKMWNDFSTLSKEARKLKQLLDEEALFAKEQLDLAIASLEEDVASFSEKIHHIDELNFPSSAKFLREEFDSYNEIQKELTLLNAFAGRINSLRKEVIKTEMRLRYKSKFLKNLSVVGDKVFPKRKELIKEISNKFTIDIKSFQEAFFGPTPKKQIPFFQLKEEIKALQNIAKILTLNTKAFTQTRLHLSECWDHIKDLESEKRKVSDELKKTLDENFEKIKSEIDLFEKKCLEEIELTVAQKEHMKILDLIKKTELFKGDIKILKKELTNAYKPIMIKEEAEKEKLKKEKEQKLKEKIEKIEGIKTEITKLIAEESQYELNEITEKKEAVLKDIETLSLNKIERQMIERLLKPLKDILIDKKERAMLDLSSDEIEALTQMKEVLNQRVKRKKEIKKQLEVHRKALGASGFDFEKAMTLNETINEEKERLVKINESIEEVEEKINQLEG